MFYLLKLILAKIKTKVKDVEMKNKRCAKLCQTIQQKLEPKFQIYLNVETKKKRVEILSEITATGGGRGSGPVFIFDLPKLLIPPNYLKTQCSLTSSATVQVSQCTVQNCTVKHYQVSQYHSTKVSQYQHQYQGITVSVSVSISQYHNITDCTVRNL